MMKKNISYISILFLIFSCSKKENFIENSEFVVSKYDTTAIDSFAEGAISVDVAEQIRQSSIAYQDSLKAKAEEEAKAKSEAEAKEEKIKADEKKKLELEKKNSEKKSTTPENPKEN